IMLLQLLLQLGFLEIIGKEILDAAKAGSLRRGKAVHERHPPEQHGEIGGKSWHGQNPRTTAMINRQAGCSASARAAGASSSGKSRISSKSMTLSISAPIEMLVTRSRMNSTTTGTPYSFIHCRAVANAAWA